MSRRTLLLALLAACAAASADVERRTLFDGALVLENVPEIPKELRYDLYRFQNVRSAGLRAWSADGNSLFVATGFGAVDSLHRVDAPLGARRQLTFFDEPMGQVARQPGGNAMLFTQDAGGSEFAQVFRLDQDSGEATMLSDGESRNGALVWDRRGTRVAFQSTRRNGASNDVWIMNPDDPDSAEIVLEAPDGTWWGPTEFSHSGRHLLIANYVSITNSRTYLLDLDNGDLTLAAGGGEAESVNLPVAFDDENNGVWLITDQGSEFAHLAWRSLQANAPVELVSDAIPWSVSDAAVSDDRKRMAFVTNENGRSHLYLLDPATREYQHVDDVPTGVISGMLFRPDGGALALTISTAQSPSDAYVLELGSDPLHAGSLTRWTESEVGGLDTTQFVIPELVHYSSFDERRIPAWIHRPRGDGPHPVVIRIHGGPESQARPGFSSTYQMWVAKLGAAVIQPNVRGSRGYGKTYLGLDNGFRREDAVRDIGALLDWIAEQPDLDAERVALYGGSYGGYMVLASAVHYSDRLRAVIDNVGISNFVTFLENTQDYRRDLRRQEYGDERDPAMRAHLQKISPLNNVEKIDAPMFVIQGENDPRVPVTEATQMVSALREQGHDVWYMNAFNEGHGYRRRENRDTMHQAMILFLRQHLLDED